MPAKSLHVSCLGIQIIVMRRSGLCINGRKSWHTKVEADMEHWGTKQPISDILIERVQRPTL